MSAMTAEVIPADQPSIAKRESRVKVIMPDEPTSLGVLDNIVANEVIEIYDPNKGRYLTPMQMADLTEETYYETFFGDQYEQFK